MSVDVPTVGERITYDWAVDVANAINGFETRASVDLLRTLDADESTNSGTPSDVTGMTFPVVNGESYLVDLRMFWSTSATNQGIGIGFRHPGGDAIGLYRITGVTSGTAETIERIRESAANNDELTVSAVNAATGFRWTVEATILYDCTASGTFAIRKARNGTSGSTGLTLYKGSRAVVTVTG